MPIYEYVCKECGERFERLLMSLDSENTVTCPYCNSEEVDRVISSFASFGFDSEGGSCAPTTGRYG